MAKVILFKAMRGETQLASVVVRMSNKKASQLLAIYGQGDHWGGNGVTIFASEVTKQDGWVIGKNTRHFPMNRELHKKITEFLGSNIQ